MDTWVASTYCQLYNPSMNTGMQYFFASLFSIILCLVPEVAVQDHSISFWFCLNNLGILLRATKSILSSTNDTANVNGSEGSRIFPNRDRAQFVFNHISVITLDRQWNESKLVQNFLNRSTLLKLQEPLWLFWLPKKLRTRHHPVNVAEHKQGRWFIHFSMLQTQVVPTTGPLHVLFLLPRTLLIRFFGIVFFWSFEKSSQTTLFYFLTQHPILVSLQHWLLTEGVLFIFLFIFYSVSSQFNINTMRTGTPSVLFTAAFPQWKQAFHKHV